MLVSHRYHGADRLHRCTGCWVPGQCLCHICASEPAVLANLADDPYGPEGWHLEAPGISGLCSQQGEQPWSCWGLLFTMASRLQADLS